MVLESTILCVDNSEYMRNGDFLPTRLQAQQDAVGMITQAKLRANPEANVGLLSLSDLDVLVTLTTDTGKVLAKLHAVQPKGQIKLVPGIKIAHLALKHRLGKNHKTRIITFVGSPIDSDEKELIKVAKKLKKEKVSVDVVSFGEVDENAELLKKFVETVNGRDGTGSHLVTIPPGPHLSDALISSAIIQGEDGAGAVIASGGGGFEFGVDPNEDPELALALRVSMEENRARQAREEAAAGSATMDTSTVEPGTASTVPAPEDEAMLARALEMSMEPGEPKSSANTGAAAEPNLAAMTEEEQIEYAMRMSMQESDTAEGTSKDEKMDVDEPSTKEGSSNPAQTEEGAEEDYSEVMNDPEFLQSVLESLPGVDTQSEAMRQAMGALTGSTKKDDKEEKKNEDKDKK